MSTITDNKDKQTNNIVWNKQKVEDIREKLIQGDILSRSPFWSNDPNWREANIVYEYSSEELEEIKKCMGDVVYFAEKYCFLMTDSGMKNIKLRKYQIELLRAFQHNKNCAVLSSRQIGKTTTSGIFLTWYLLFNFDKTALVVANKFATTVEVIDKIKNIISYLPFFIKPGVIVNNQGNMKFDNNCRIIGQATTKTTGIGLSINLCFIDEAAHIPENFVESFFRSVYPTLSAMPTAKMIITSTPNGMNKFYDIYMGAITGGNDFKALRVDWWDVPGRDDNWRKQEIANLGSEELFNQEYGNQFLSSGRLLLNGAQLKKIKSNISEYKWKEIEFLDDLEINYDKLKWHPNFDPMTVCDTDGNNFVFSLDISSGKGGDYSIINIFKVVPLPEVTLSSIKTYNDETDFFGLLQVGTFKDNQTDIDILSKIILILLFKVFNPENVKILCEMNFEGGLMKEKLYQHKEFWPEILIHTKHSETARSESPGVRLNSNNKPLFCMDLKKCIQNNRIIVNEKYTFEELSSFGMTNKGSYKSQSGHDDLAMSCVNLTLVFNTGAFFELVENTIDHIPTKYKNLIDKTMANIERDDDDLDSNFLRSLME